MYFSTGAHHLWFLAWVAPVPVLALAFGLAGGSNQAQSAVRGSLARLAVAAFLAAAAGNAGWVVLYRGILPAAAIVPAVLLLAGLFALATILTWLVADRVGVSAGIVFFPAAWVSFEFAMSRLSPNGTAGSLAYSQTDVLPLIQLAAWAGLPAIVCIVLLAASGVAAFLGGGIRGEWRLSRAVVPGLAVLAALALGQWRLNTANADRQVVVGLISSDAAMQRFETTERADALPVLERYLAAGAHLARRGAEALVMPEKMIGLASQYQDEARAMLASFCAGHPALVVVGINTTGVTPRRNLAEVYSNGHRVVQYEKRRLVPGLEAGYERGSVPGLHRAPGGMVGAAICKDLDFPALMSEYGRAGVGLLFVPAWDFVRDARIHSRMAVMRGVEGGYSVARSAADGLLTGSDYLGRVVAEIPSGAEAVATLLVALPIGPGRTFYSRHGDWFAWLNAAGAVLLLLLSLTPGTARAPAPPAQ